MFDNDGTLWCEKPMPIQLDFILRRLVEMAEAEPELRDRQPWKAAYERDYGWLGAADGRALRRRRHATCGRWPAGILAAYEGISVEDFEAQSDAFLRSAQHPTLGRGYLDCAYAPMVELLGYLEANGFANYIASGGGRDFMRPISQEVYGIPRERVIGSATALATPATTRGGTITHKAEADYLDDGPQKPIRIWSRTGRRPLLAAGNSNGDIPMLDFAQHARQAVPAPARPARRRRARVRLHHRRRAGAGAGRAATAGRSSASRTTGPPSSRFGRGGTHQPRRTKPATALTLPAAWCCSGRSFDSSRRRIPRLRPASRRRCRRAPGRSQRSPDRR